MNVLTISSVLKHDQSINMASFTEFWSLGGRRCWELAVLLGATMVGAALIGGGPLVCKGRRDSNLSSRRKTSGWMSGGDDFLLTARWTGGQGTPRAVQLVQGNTRLQRSFRSLQK